MPVETPDIKDFEDIESLDKAYKKLIAKADDDDEAELRVKHSAARAEFFEGKARSAELRAARAAAFEQYPLAKEFADDIRGDTPEQVMANAKRVHERLEAMVGQKTQAQKDAEALAQQQQQQAIQSYGQPAAAGGGTPPPAQASREQDTERKIHDALAKGHGLQGGDNRMLVNQFLADRIRSGAEAAIHNPSYRSFARPGTAEDKRITDDRTKRKAQPGGV